MQSAIEKITRKAARIANGRDKIQPGQAAKLSTAASVGDEARQGDLYLRVVASVPNDYSRAKKASLQLVPGNTEGAKHCLDSLAGLAVYLPPNWGNGESLLGPCLVLTESRTVRHPVHGDVTLSADTIVQCGYQREWDAEQARERRNAD
jgi:hypothetical protein